MAIKLNLKARSWHTWASLALALPIFIVGASAVFIAHKKSLGTEEVKVAAQWLPGYRSADARSRGPEPRAALTTHAGATYVGAQEGLFRLEGGRLTPVEEFAGVPVRGLAEGGFGLVVAAKSGIWLERAGRWQRAEKGDAWSAAARPDGSVVVAVKDRGLLASADGREWLPDAALAGALAALAEDQPAHARPLTLGKLIMDLHTGQAFLGKEAEWIWIDLVGLTLCLLAMTGIYMWWRAERRKAAAALA